MRYLFRLLCVCALGVIPLVGCMDFELFEDSMCEGMVCDDDNECTEDGCSSWGFGPLGCHHDPVDDGMACTFDGLAGVCLGGLCGAEHLCDGVVCEDDDLCTDDTCAWDGTCVFTAVDCSDGNSCTDGTCDPETGECNQVPEPDGTRCMVWFTSGTCQNGKCT